MEQEPYSDVSFEPQIPGQELYDEVEINNSPKKPKDIIRKPIAPPQLEVYDDVDVTVDQETYDDVEVTQQQETYDDASIANQEVYDDAAVTTSQELYDDATVETQETYDDAAPEIKVTQLTTLYVL